MRTVPLMAESDTTRIELWMVCGFSCVMLDSAVHVVGLIELLLSVVLQNEKLAALGDLKQFCYCYCCRQLKMKSVSDKNL